MPGARELIEMKNCWLNSKKTDEWDHEWNFHLSLESAQFPLDAAA